MKNEAIYSILLDLHASAVGTLCSNSMSIEQQSMAVAACAMFCMLIANIKSCMQHQQTIHMRCCNINFRALMLRLIIILIILMLILY